MADQYIKDAQKNLEEFGNIWEERGYEFMQAGKHADAEKAYALRDKANEKMQGLMEVLEEDEKLDQEYSKIKRKAIA